MKKTKTIRTIFDGFGLCLTLSILCFLFLGALSCNAQSDKSNKSVNDKDIVNHLEIEYLMDESVSFNSIDIKVTDGIVSLSGTVDNILAKEKARDIAEATVGVRSVINQIKVKPPVKLTDKDIQKDVKAALLDDPAADSYEVNVKVKNGVVELTGKVDSWQEKQLCATVSKGVKGVIKVDNKIDFEFKTDRVPGEIKPEVEGVLANDLRVDDGLIEVLVDGNRVILKGTVGSAQEKRQAYYDAWVSGVDMVKDDELEVNWFARDKMRRTEPYSSRSDKEIRKAVTDSFIYDPRVFSFNVGVDVNSGMVTLSGVVDNLEAKKAAGNDAKNTIGVMRVVNNIKVRPKKIPSNDELVSRVVKALLDDPYIERFKLDISAYSGTVYLSGNVNTSWEKNRAANIAENLKGVLYVVNNIDFKHKWKWLPDWELKEKVKDELFWSPFVDIEELDIKVKNGVVTLSGTVYTYGDVQSAEDNAYEAGAKDVINNLTVKYVYYGPYYYGPYSPMGYYYPIVY